MEDFKKKIIAGIKSMAVIPVEDCSHPLYYKGSRRVVTYHRGKTKYRICLFCGKELRVKK